MVRFGTSGLRGLSVDLDGGPPALYTTAVGRYLLDSGMARRSDAILIGRDLQDCSQKIAMNCADALAGRGFEVRHCRMLPTPALGLYGLEEKAACLMVTGSQIPADPSPYVTTAMQGALAAGSVHVAGLEANGGVLIASDFNVNHHVPQRCCRQVWNASSGGPRQTDRKNKRY
ncbi:UNVERIFIED_ORG: hypothetical protein GGI66_001696 [Rhizobium esperanzae]